MGSFLRISNLKFTTKKVEQKVRKKIFSIKKNAGKTWDETLYTPEPMQGILEDLEVKLVNPLVGIGLFATKPITRYTFIGEYLGLVRPRKLSFLSDSDYVFGYTIRDQATRWVVDAGKMGNTTRFINHSYEPNLIPSSWIQDGIGHIGFFAKKTIMENEQLTFDYGPYYWKKRSYPQSL